MKKWLAGALTVVAVGGIIAISQPLTTYATENPTAVQNYQRSAAPGAGIGRSQGSMVEVVSNLLGKDKTEITKERQSGKSMVEIAKTKGVDEQKLINTVIANRKSVLDQRLKDGKITEEQAEYCNENMVQRIKANMNRTNIGPANGWRGKGKGNMRGGRAGGMWQQQVQ